MAIHGMSVGGVALMGGGLLFVWSAFHGASLTGSLRDLISGKQPSGSDTNPITGGGDSGTSAPVSVNSQGGNPSDRSAQSNQRTGQFMAGAYGWNSGREWTALNNLVMSESGWRNTAQNPTSTAYGIFQFLDSTWATVGYTKTSDPVTQIAAGLAYVKQRYGDPIKAWAFHMANGYY